jgi:hypothetical protein
LRLVAWGPLFERGHSLRLGPPPILGRMAMVTTIPPYGVALADRALEEFR